MKSFSLLAGASLLFASQTAAPSEEAPFVPAVAPLASPLPAESIVGVWWTEGKEGRMKFVKTKSGTFEAIVLGGKEPELRDVNNPNPKLRDRKVVGQVIMWNLHYEDGEYVDGYCYNPRDGHTYRLKAKLLSQKVLKIRGYLAVPLLGQSQEWTRAE